MMKYSCGFIFGVILFSGCAPLGGGGAKEKSYVESYSLEGIKLISPSIHLGDDTTAFRQSVYEVGPERRLLMRFEKLADHVENIDTREGKKVMLEMSVQDVTQVPLAERSLRVCPISRNWMMLATWNRAHLFTNGTWTNAGGDYDSDGCVGISIVRDAETPEKVVHFDVTNWYLNFPKGKSENFGLILIAFDSIKITGDTSGGFSPRLHFAKFAPKVKSRW